MVVIHGFGGDYVGNKKCSFCGNFFERGIYFGFATLGHLDICIKCAMMLKLGSKEKCDEKIKEKLFEGAKMKFRFKHYHFTDNSHVTRCDIENEQREILAYGVALCSPRDNFSRASGRCISAGRALKAWNGMQSISPIRRTGKHIAAEALVFDANVFNKGEFVKEV